jgi:hypothetical protein
MKLSETRPYTPYPVAHEVQWDEMTPVDQIEALLQLLAQLTQIVEIQGIAIGELDDRVKTLELSSAV